MAPAWTDIAQGIGSIASCIIAIVGFWLVLRQLRQVESTIRKDALESLYGRAHQILQVVLDDPTLRPYFHDNAPLPSDLATQCKIATYSEMILDFYELISYQREFMPAELVESWEKYIKHIHDHSPALQQHLALTGTWYSHEMRRFLRRP